MLTTPSFVKRYKSSELIVKIGEKASMRLVIVFWLDFLITIAPICFSVYKRIARKMKNSK